MPQDAVAGKEADVKSKTEETIAQLAHLLQATPSAEELTQSWARSRKESGPRLQDLGRALDAGKVIEKGVPMWIIVRMCKASWHKDGTWPLLGADEVTTPALQSVGIVRSVHPSAVLLRPKGTNKFQLPVTEEADTDVRQWKEPSAEDIAASYRKRGIYVEEAICFQDDW